MLKNSTPPKNIVIIISIIILRDFDCSHRLDEHCAIMCYISFNSNAFCRNLPLGNHRNEIFWFVIERCKLLDQKKLIVTALFIYLRKVKKKK